MVTLNIYSVGPLSTNCYLLHDEVSNDAILIDPGDEGDYVSEQILVRRAHLQGILLTHGHYDHVLGLLPLMLNFPEVPAYLHTADHFLFARGDASARYWSHDLPHDPLPPVSVLQSSELCNRTRFGTLQLECLHTPGHTPGSCCFYSRDQGWLFTGDTLGEEGTSENNHVYTRPLELGASRARLRQLQATTHIYPGHGDSYQLRSKTK